MPPGEAKLKMDFRLEQENEKQRRQGRGVVTFHLLNKKADSGIKYCHTRLAATLKSGKCW